jgi:N-acetyl-gamma-glutamylphosphate reductase
MYSASASRNPRAFAIRASGYLGGNTIARIVKKHPDWDVVVLERTEEEEEVNAAWPNAQVALGDLDDAETLRDETSKANVVLSRMRFPHLQSICSDTDNPHFQVLPMLWSEQA